LAVGGGLALVHHNHQHHPACHQMGRVARCETAPRNRGQLPEVAPHDHDHDHQHSQPAVSEKCPGRLLQRPPLWLEHLQCHRRRWGYVLLQQQLLLP